MPDACFCSSASSPFLILANPWSKTSFGIALLRLPLSCPRILLIQTLRALSTAANDVTAVVLFWVQYVVTTHHSWSPHVCTYCVSPGAQIRYPVFVG